MLDAEIVTTNNVLLFETMSSSKYEESSGQ